MKILKYPRTTHIEGSRLQPGDEDLEQVRWASLADQFLVIEEKVDGANSAISFDADEQLYLQSRGHFLVGGARERHFALMKTWANCHAGRLWELLGSRYIMYGEWVYAKHTIFYDQLPHYFLGFDIFDREQQCFLDTASRHAMLNDTPVVSVPVLWEGFGRELKEVTSLVERSLYKSENWKQRLIDLAQSQGLDHLRVLEQTDPEDLMEGLYIKVENEGRTIGRHKWIRRSFLDSVQAADGHWLNRPIIPNQLEDGVDLYGN